MVAAANDFVFYKRVRFEGDVKILHFWSARRSNRPGYYHKWLSEMNRFSDAYTQPPAGYHKQRSQSQEWIQKCMWNPAMRRVQRRAMPQHDADAWYAVHDNGRRPFVVYVGDTGVTVYRIAEDEYTWQEDWADNMADNLNMYTQRVLHIPNPEQVFIPDNREDPGNAILVHVCDNTYTFIGENIFSFSADDRIREFYSVVIGADVSYPVAVGNEFAYFLIEDAAVPIDRMGNVEWDENPYRKFYDEIAREERLPIPDKQVIQERL